MHFRSWQRSGTGRSCLQLLPQRRGLALSTLFGQSCCSTHDMIVLTCGALLLQEDSFHLVDNRPAAKNKGQRRFNPQRFAHRNTQFSRGQPEQPHQARQKQQKQRQFQNFHRDNQRVRQQHKLCQLLDLLQYTPSWFATGYCQWALHTVWTVPTRLVPIWCELVKPT